MRREDDGTNERTTWGDRLKITSVPVDDLAARRRVQADLVQLAIQFKGLKGERAGNYQSQFVDYEQEREMILSRLAPRHRVVV